MLPAAGVELAWPTLEPPAGRAVLPPVLAGVAVVPDEAPVLLPPLAEGDGDLLMPLLLPAAEDPAAAAEGATPGVPAAWAATAPWLAAGIALGAPPDALELVVLGVPLADCRACSLSCPCWKLLLRNSPIACTGAVASGAFHVVTGTSSPVTVALPPWELCVGGLR